MDSIASGLVQATVSHLLDPYVLVCALAVTIALCSGLVARAMEACEAHLPLGGGRKSTVAQPQL